MKTHLKSAFALMLWGLPGLLHPQQCLDNNVLTNNAADTAPAGTDGLVHTTYSFIDADGNVITPDASINAEFTGAVAAWNNNSSTTGIQLSPAPEGEGADIQVALLRIRLGPREDVPLSILLRQGFPMGRRF